jgi:transaldolase/glucose-6-phosphate isomerase
VTTTDIDLSRESVSLGGYQEVVDQRLGHWQEIGYPDRLWRQDYTLWSPEPVPELVDRLGWLELPETMQAQAPELADFGREISSAGMRTVVLLGMGGSSLAPEVLQRTFGPAAGYPALRVLDSTHPDAVAGLSEELDLSSTLFVVSSKSGTTIETLSFFYTFWDRVQHEVEDARARFVAITDPGSHLAELAQERGFRRVFLAPSDVGGRFSALSHFGLVPAALLGLDVELLLARGRAMAMACGPQQTASASPGLRLGAALGELALAGRDKLVLLTTPELASFPDWVEQLVAESTGKEGEGILPVVGEAELAAESYAADRFFVALSSDGEGSEELGRRLNALEEAGHPVVRIRMEDSYDLGAEIFRWEVAVAAAGSVLGIQPFDQPDVQLAKEMAKQVMSGGDPAVASAELGASQEERLSAAIQQWMGKGRPGDYIAIQAFLAPSPATVAALTRLQQELQQASGLAVTIGFGPRFLHSTGQLHKGGPPTGLFLQLVDEPGAQIAVPETDYDFGGLVGAQALGDARALLQKDRRLLRVVLDTGVESGMMQLREAIGV